MSVTVETQGSFKLKVDANTYLCARSINFGGSADAVDVSCAESGDVVETRRGRKSYTLNAEGVVRVATGADVATQVTAAVLTDLFESGEIVPFEIGTATPGAQVASGTAYVQSFDLAAPFDGEPTYNVTFGVTGPITYTTNP